MTVAKSRGLRSVFWIGFSPMTDDELLAERESTVALAEAYRRSGDKARATQALRDAILLGGILLQRSRSATAFVSAATEGT